MSHFIKTIFLLLLLGTGNYCYAQEYAKNPVKRAKTSTATKAVVKDSIGKQKVTDPDAMTNDANFEALMVKGIALSNEANYTEALKIYTQAMALSNEENAYRALFGRGSTYFRLKEFDKALTDYNVIINDTKLPHGNARGHAYNMRGIINHILGNDKEACSDHKMARELGDPSVDPPVFDCK